MVRHISPPTIRVYILSAAAWTKCRDPHCKTQAGVEPATLVFTPASGPVAAAPPPSHKQEAACVFFFFLFERWKLSRVLLLNAHLSAYFITFLTNVWSKFCPQALFTQDTQLQQSDDGRCEGTKVRKNNNSTGLHAFYFRHQLQHCCLRTSGLEWIINYMLNAIPLVLDNAVSNGCVRPSDTGPGAPSG